jgi:3-phosphoshikimate 1-carboxyvinyltransferase
MELTDPYTVPVWTRPCSGAVTPPGSKSLTNRALVLAALAKGRTRLTGALLSRDTRLLLAGLKALGWTIEADATGQTLEVEGSDGRIPNRSAELQVGNAGTAARFLTALVCLRPKGSFTFRSDAEMEHRPMGGLLQALQRLGARFEFHGAAEAFPFTVHTSGLAGGHWEVEATASSQMLSALLMVAPCAASDVHLCSGPVRPAFVEMTCRLLQVFGVTVTGNMETGFRIPARGIPGDRREYAIEADATAASYFAALPLVTGGELTLSGLSADSLQGDTRFLDLMRRFGVSVSPASGNGLLIKREGPLPQGEVTVDMGHFSDTFLTLAAVAPLLPALVRIEGIGHTRFQETDRIKAVATELERCGVHVEEGDDSVSVGGFARGFPSLETVSVDTYKDHRVAMAFSLLGCHDRRGDGTPWMEIRDPACCGKTFPGYFDILNKLYLKSHDK